MNILFVCTGNTCRSPMAAALLEDMAKNKGIGLDVKSAGIYALDGQNATREAMEALKDNNINIEDHRASIVHRDLLNEADLILTMGKSHKSELVSRFGDFDEKIYTLNEYAYGVEKDIADPFGGNINIYRNTKEEIEKALEEIIGKLGR